MTTHSAILDPTDDHAWAAFRDAFSGREDTVYLNHGSFGLALNVVRNRRDELLNQMECQPMDFYLRKLEPLLAKARQSLADFVSTAAENLALVDNATYAMNLVANSIQLQSGDEVLMTDQVYGAVRRIWQQRADAAGAKLVEAKLPERIESRKQVVDVVLGAASPKTRIAVISHIVSVSGLILPVNEICESFRRQGVLTCVDGPHALVQVNVDLERMGCDFYTASCHKWMCGPLGTGFVFVAPAHRDRITQPVTGWGRLDPNVPRSWDEEQIWLGTRNMSGVLALPAAIEFWNQIGLDTARARMNLLAATAETMLVERFQTETIADRGDGWYGSMAHVALPGDGANLQAELWHQASIEVPVWQLNDRWWIRVSCHLYNSTDQLELLVDQLDSLLQRR